MEAHFNTSLTLPHSIVAIGAFDGVHQGHQAVIRKAVQRGKFLNIPTVVYTFDPPPRVYFQGAHMLTPIHEKLAKLNFLGVDHVMIANFDKFYASRSAQEFIEVLANLNPVEIMVGEDFRFGTGRQGDIQMLQNYFHVSVMEPVNCLHGTRISSTRIRELISNGDQNYSKSLLGWPVES